MINPVMFSVAGTVAETVPDSVQEGLVNPVEGVTSQKGSYTIPPVFWMFLFLISGFILTRFLMED